MSSVYHPCSCAGVSCTETIQKPDRITRSAWKKSSGTNDSDGGATKDDVCLKIAAAGAGGTFASQILEQNGSASVAGARIVVVSVECTVGGRRNDSFVGVDDRRSAAASMVIAK